MVKKNDKLTVVFCDASWCPETKRAGWAAWMIKNGERKRFSNQHKESCLSSNEAETTAIAISVHLAIKAWPGSGAILIQSDCMHAIKVMENKLKGTKKERAARQVAHSLALEGKKTLIFRHVQGHMADNAPRNFVNAWCDRHARAEMQKARMKGL